MRRAVVVFALVLCAFVLFGECASKKDEQIVDSPKPKTTKKPTSSVEEDEEVPTSTRLSTAPEEKTNTASSSPSSSSSAAASASSSLSPTTSSRAKTTTSPSPDDVHAERWRLFGADSDDDEETAPVPATDYCAEYLSCLQTAREKVDECSQENVRLARREQVLINGKEAQRREKQRKAAIATAGKDPEAEGKTEQPEEDRDLATTTGATEVDDDPALEGCRARLDDLHNELTDRMVKLHTEEDECIVQKQQRETATIKPFAIHKEAQCAQTVANRKKNLAQAIVNRQQRREAIVREQSEDDQLTAEVAAAVAAAAQSTTTAENLEIPEPTTTAYNPLQGLANLFQNPQLQQHKDKNNGNNGARQRAEKKSQLAKKQTRAQAKRFAQCGREAQQAQKDCKKLALCCPAVQTCKSAKDRQQPIEKLRRDIRQQTQLCRQSRRQILQQNRFAAGLGAGAAKRRAGGRQGRKALKPESTFETLQVKAKEDKAARRGAAKRLGRGKKNRNNAALDGDIAAAIGAPHKRGGRGRKAGRGTSPAPVVEDERPTEIDEVAPPKKSRVANDDQ